MDRFSAEDLAALLAMSGGRAGPRPTGMGGGVPTPPLAEFRAGVMLVKDGRATPDLRRGRVVVDKEGAKIRIRWIIRPTETLEWTLKLSVNEATLERRVGDGRIFHLKYKDASLNGSNDKYFWMQEPEADKDAEIHAKVSAALSGVAYKPPATTTTTTSTTTSGATASTSTSTATSPATTATTTSTTSSSSSSPAPPAPAPASSSSSSPATTVPAGGVGMSDAPSSSSSSSSTPVTTTPAPSTAAAPAPAAPTATAAATPATATAAGTSTTGATGAAGGSANVFGGARGAELFQQMLRQMGTAAATMRGPDHDLEDVLAAERVLPELTDDMINNLVQYLPPGQQTAGDLRDQLRSAHLRSSINRLDAALNTQFSAAVMGFGLRPSGSRTGVAGFIDAIQAQADAERKTEASASATTAPTTTTTSSASSPATSPSTSSSAATKSEDKIEGSGNMGDTDNAGSK